uniref:Uncharacterized protein n=1 Tax=Nelumbo nucifera TaxID=4432 RepID=A0A822ZM35_NELNU|nr:TPA_asm: hypothetical protein HUJ06_001048 [Nelumbo nucifera]
MNTDVVPLPECIVDSRVPAAVGSDDVVGSADKVQDEYRRRSFPPLTKPRAEHSPGPLYITFFYQRLSTILVNIASKSLKLKRVRSFNWSRVLYINEEHM